VKRIAAGSRKDPSQPKGRFDVFYAPIASLLDGSLYGYEAVPCNRITGKQWTADRFFEVSEREGALYENERNFRERAMQGMRAAPGSVKWFLPMSACMTGDLRSGSGITLRLAESSVVRPEHIVLLLADDGAAHSDAFYAEVRQYRTQGFRIALFGIGTDRDSLDRLVALKPDYACIGREWMPDGPQDAVGVSLLQAIGALARKEKIVLLANGLNWEDQLSPLISCGVGYAQGAWIGPACSSPAGIDSTVAKRIRQEVRRRFRGPSGILSELIEPALMRLSGTTVSSIAQEFEARREANGLVIVEEGGRPVGLLMKDKLHQMLAGQFGQPLYWNRPVDKIMDTQPLVAEAATPIDQLSQMAMSREPDKLYDAIVVTKDGIAVGIVSVGSLLEQVTSVRIAAAQWANPLTGLPGNEPIRREISRRLEERRPFAILYADLDHFKWYNDQYGFHRGDDVIRFTGETLQAVVDDNCPENSFVGHIGGDDFIVMIEYGNPVAVAERMLDRFAKGVRSFADGTKGPIRDRAGMQIEGSELSLSLAMLLYQGDGNWTPEWLAERSALLKKKAKKQAGNSLAVDTLERCVDHDEGHPDR